jgi:hypothetical protein
MSSISIRLNRISLVIDRGTITFWTEHDHHTEFGKVYVQLQIIGVKDSISNEIKDRVCTLRDFDWTLDTWINESEIRLIGISSTLGITQTWVIKPNVANNSIDCNIKIKLEKDLNIIYAYTGFNGSDLYWQWNNSYRYGAFPYSEHSESDTIVWAGNPLSSGLYMNSGRKHLPKIHVIPYTRISYDVSKLVLNRENRNPEIRFYRIDNHYGPVLLTKGEYTLFSGNIDFEQNDLKIFELSNIHSDFRNHPNRLIIGMNYPAFVKYCIEEFQQQEPIGQFDILVEEYVLIKDELGSIISYPNLKITSWINKLISWITLFGKLRKKKYRVILLLDQKVDSISSKYIALLFALCPGKIKYLIDSNGNIKRISSGKYLIKIICPFVFRRIKIILKIILIPIDIFLTGIIFLYLLIHPLSGKVKESRD